MKFKKALVLLFIVVMTFAFTSSLAFTDLNEKFPAYVEAINDLSKKGIVSGYPDDTFRGSNLVTRAEAIKMIVTAFELKAREGEPIKLFEDVKDKWFESYVNIATSNKIVEGYEDGSFKPNNTITYGEISTIIARLKELSIPKKEEGDAWYVPYWSAIEEAGYFSDIATNDLIAINNARRDNVALIIYNALTYKKPIEKQETEKPVEKEEANEISDIDTTKIYFGTVDTKPYVRGKDYIDVNNFNDSAWSLFLKDYAEAPEDGSLIFYKIRKSKAVNLLKTVKAEDIRDAFVVEELAEDEEDGVKIKDHDKYLSLADDDEYTFNGSDIKLNKLNYFEVNVVKNKNNGNIEFKSGTDLAKEDITFKKGSRIIVDADKKLFIVIKGLSLNEEI